MEFKMNELNNDYITLWSRYFFSDAKAEVLKQLEVMAEMGQINAIQSWYELHYVGENTKIDAIAETMRAEDDFNHQYAKGLYLFKKPEVQKEYYDLRRKMGKCMYASNRTKKKGLASLYTEEAIKLARQVMDLAPVKHYQKAYEMALELGKEYQSGVFFERANEIMATIRNYHPLPEKQIELNKDICKSNKEIRRILEKEYARLNESIMDFNPTDSPVLSFYLARSYDCFQENSVNEKKHREVTSIYEKLANREYSKTFKRALESRAAVSGEDE